MKGVGRDRRFDALLSFVVNFPQSVKHILQKAIFKRAGNIEGGKIANSEEG